MLGVAGRIAWRPFAVPAGGDSGIEYGMVRTNVRKWLRNLHRWLGLLSLGLLLLYCVTGVLLNHRRAFGYFIDRIRTVRPLEAPVDTSEIATVVARLAARTGEGRPPTVVKITPDGTVSLLYGSHGAVTYTFAPGAPAMERVEKRPRQPWFRLNRFHKVVRTHAAWLVLADFAALCLVFVALTGLFLFRYRRLDRWLLAAGLLLVAGGVLAL